MTARRALVIACLVVSPGTLLRIGPHLDRLLGSRPGAGATATGAPSVSPSAMDAPPSSRLAQRPTTALAFGFSIELVLQIVLVVLLVRSHLFASLWQALPAAFRVAAALLFTLLMAGFLGGTAATFPFVAWRMYSGDHDSVPVVYGLAGTTRGGAVRDLDVERLLPVLGAHRLEQMLAAQVGWVDESTNDVERHARQDVQRRTLAALGHISNARGHDDPLRQLSLSVARVPLGAGSPPWLRDRRLLQTVDIEQ